MSFKNLHCYHLQRATNIVYFLTSLFFLHQSLKSEPVGSPEMTCVMDDICLLLKTTSFRQSHNDQNIAATPIISLYQIARLMNKVGFFVCSSLQSAHHGVFSSFLFHEFQRMISVP
ncbi:Putative ubiquitin-conjugating enzyme family [Zea mays]|jgi:hypothetical protein|uniref:Putative ubiquitin-conjugating enzyme family n=1 Tax=Zea mays TaxID=4577 RepID=A0A1D6PKW8_MAIZE|nr:Putative ubiquitin-conjugating enzyme family [Zea mays]